MATTVPIDTTTTRPSVLIVDDEASPREAIRLALGARFQACTVPSGEKALESLRLRHVDVVTLDSMMPGLGGLETFERIRALDPDVQIVVVSGETQESLARGLSDAASAWIQKPFDTADLVEAVGRAAAETRFARLRRARALVCEAGETAGSPSHDLARAFLRDITKRLGIVVGFARLLRHGQLHLWHAEEVLDFIEVTAHDVAALTVNFLKAEQPSVESRPVHRAPARLNEIS